MSSNPVNMKFEQIVIAARIILPLPRFENPSSYMERYCAVPQFAEGFEKLRDAARDADKEKQTALYEHAKQYLGEENDRGASIMTRAQALLIAQTFFGTFLAFGTGIIGRTETFQGWRALAVIVLLAYTVVLVLLLTFNALRATAGLSYRRIGTSDLVSSLQGSDVTMIRDLALHTLSNYRIASVANTWRMAHLQYAQRCLGNIVITLAFLIGVVFWIAIR